MIIRIVKMTFDEAMVKEFEDVFHNSKEKIRAFEGCAHLQLLKDINTPNIYFTYSYWENEDALNAYRHSPLFETVWAATKKLFIAKPEAWSVEQEVVLD